MISDNLLSEQIQFFHYNKKNGLPSDMTYSITEDKKDIYGLALKTLFANLIQRSTSLKTMTDSTFTHIYLLPKCLLC